MISGMTTAYLVPWSGCGIDNREHRFVKFKAQRDCSNFPHNEEDGLNDLIDYFLSLTSRSLSD